MATIPQVAVLNGIPATIGGTQLCASLPPGDSANPQERAQQLRDRDEQIFGMIQAGHVPAILRDPWLLNLNDGKNELSLQVFSDVLGVGHESDWVRTPVAGPTAQRVADLFGCSLVTRKLSDLVWKNSFHATPITHDWYQVNGGRKMLATDSFIQHNSEINGQLTQKGFFTSDADSVSGIKKDVILSNALLSRPGKLCIYGWHEPSGKAIQPLSWIHELTYTDYSHGIRFVDRQCKVNGQDRDFADILSDPVLSKMVSDEGPIGFKRYPTEWTTNPGPSGKTLPPGGSPGGNVAPGGRPPTGPSTKPPSGGEGDDGGSLLLAGGLFLAWLAKHA
jgi:hypothetical protein